MKFEHIHQSSWLGDYINKYVITTSPISTFVEIGVGNIIDQNYLKNSYKYVNKQWHELPICGSNTIELLQAGWVGYYIDPEQSFLDQALLLAPDKTKIFTKCCGCGNKEEKKILGDGESFKCNSISMKEATGWVGKECIILPTYQVLNELKVPRDVDFCSIDVEGYELEVLSGIDFNLFTPKNIVIEHNHTGLENIQRALEPLYKCTVHDDLNAVFKLI